MNAPAPTPPKLSISRRRFLQASAVLAAAGASGRALGANDRIRVGILGCRNRGWQVASGMIASGAEVVAFSDCDTAMHDIAVDKLNDRLPENHRFEQDFRRLLDDPDIDVIAVATPDHWHAVMASLALDAGKHVYLEKPATFNIDEGKRLVAKSKGLPGQVVQVGTQHRSGAHFIQARDFVRGGGLGRVGFVRCWITHNRGVVPVVPDTDPPETLDYDLWTGPAPMRPHNPELTHYNWHWTRANGTGEMGNWGAHWLDTARMLLDLDLPASVSAYGGQYIVHDAKQWPDTQTVLYHYPDLTMIWEQRLWTRRGVCERGGGCELSGEKGALVIDRGGWVFYPNEGPAEKHKNTDNEEVHMANFLDVIRGTAKPNADMDTGHRSAVLCHLGNIATTLGRSLTLDTETQTFPNDAEANAMLSYEYRAPWQQA
jgi:predicted dehydrogenase